jgi:CheY-like chemotaxis protein
MARVLVIDNNALIGKMATQYLEGHGCEVEFSNSPFGVLGMVRNFRPDIILLDINMPGLRGDTLARLLQDNRNKLNEFKVVLFSSEDEDFQKDLVANSLADGYFLKNGSTDGLEKVVRKFTPEHVAS